MMENTDMFDDIIDNILSKSFYTSDVRKKVQSGNLSDIFVDMINNPDRYSDLDIPIETTLNTQITFDNRERLSPSEWCTRYRLIKGKPMSFNNHRYQIPIIEDMNPKIVVEKAAQLGLSEIMLSKIFWWGDYHKGRSNVIYTFPTFNDMCTYATARIQPIIDDAKIITSEDYGYTLEDEINEVTYISTMLEINNTQIKKIRDTYLFLKGTISDRNAISVDSDWNIHDEVNFSDQATLNKFRSRIGAETSMGWEYNFSTPTIPGYGISEMYQKSDQKRWYIRCPHCNKRQHMEFETHIVDVPRKSLKEEQKYIYQCPYCKNEITKDTIVNGEFISEYPHNKEYSGYHLDKMLVKSATQLIKSKESYRRISDFYNFDLGRSYAERTISLSEDTVRECMNPNIKFWGYAKPEDGIVMGVDQGDTVWAIFSRYNELNGKRQIIYMEQIDEKECVNNDPFQRLDELIQRYNVQCGVIDMNPNKNDARKLCLKYQGKIFMATYASYKGQIITFPNIHNGDMVVNIDRTEKFKECFNNMYIHKTELPSGTTIGELYVQHMTNIKKESSKNDETSEIKEWFTAIGPDHLAHANLYNEVALEMYQTVINSDDEIKPMATRKNQHWNRTQSKIQSDNKYGDPMNPQVVKNRFNLIKDGR